MNRLLDGLLAVLLWASRWRIGQTLGGPIAAWLLMRDVRKVLRQGTVRNLEDLQGFFRRVPFLADAADDMDVVMPDKARYVLDRDSDEWSWH